MLSEILGLGLLLVLPADGPGDAEVVERVLAVVDRRPVLLTEVRTMGALKGVSDATALEALIDEMLMYAEARRYPQAQPTAAEEAAALASLRRLPGNALPEPDLARVARRQATILKYVGLRFRPLLHVSDEAVRQAFDTQFAGQSGAPPFAEIAARIRDQLADQELDARIEEWARQLRSAADINYVAAEPDPGR
jgi:hypothetical protein